MSADYTVTRMGDKVTCSKAVLDLYSAELAASHRMLDRAGIPTSGFDEQLSISQRVELLVKQNARLKAVAGA